MKSRFLLLVLIAPCFTGCIRKHEEKPIACTLPTEWKAPLPNGSEATNLPVVTTETVFTKTCYRWWEVYNNDDLNKLMEKAFSGNFTLKAYFNRIEEALADSGIVLADLYPQIIAFAGADKSRIPKSNRIQNTSMTGGAITLSPVPGSPPTFKPSFTKSSSSAYKTNLNMGLLLSYEVDLWGKLSMRYAAEKELITGSQEDYLAARLSLSADISDYFFRTLYYTTQIQLEDKKLNSLSQLISIEKERIFSGTVPEDSLLSYEQARDESRSQKENLIRLRSEAETRLAFLTGVQPNEFFLPSNSFKFTPPELPSQISSQVLLNRPDVSSLYYTVQASALDVDAAVADLLPSLIIGPNFPSLITGPAVGMKSDKASSLLKWKNHVWSLGASLSYDLFDGGRKKALINKNKALFLEHINQYQERVLLAIKEIEDSLYSLHEAKANLKNQKNRFREATALNSLFQSRFKVGLASKIDYLQSLVDLCTKEQDLHQKELNYLQSSIALYTAIGGSTGNAPP